MSFMENKIIVEDMFDIYRREIKWQKFRNQTVLISGATGMLASYLVYFLIFLNEKYLMNVRIVLLARNSEKCFYRFDKFLEKEYIKLYDFNINTPWNIPDNVDYIIHAASLASPQYYKTMPVEVAEPNVIGTYHMLNLAREKHVKKVLYFSSGDIYGKLPQNTKFIKEDMMGIIDPLDEHSCYGESKRMGETWCFTFNKEYQIPTVIARIGHTYGPTMDLENDPRVFASFMKCVFNKENIVMYSDGRAKRPFCYIADATAAFLLLLLEGKSGEAYNVCNSNSFISILELANILVGLQPELNLKVIRKVRSMDESYLENRANHDNLPTEEKLKKLGWECHFGVESGFRRVLDSFLEKI